jgi:hypothetical protein
VQIFFDVHGTLLSTDDTRIRPGVDGLLETLAGEGHLITLWSTAGPGYARSFAQRFGLLPWVFEFRGKGDAGLRPDVCVDDHPGYLLGRIANVRVDPYRGDPDDREMERVGQLLSSVLSEHSTEQG